MSIIQLTQRRENRAVDKIVFFVGLGGALGGVALFLYQGIMYLMHNAWSSSSLYSILESAPSLQAQVDASPGLANALQGCPLFAALIGLGLILLLVGSRLSGRYVN
jgi:hypothetical protein